jgi:hypothetical protein
MPSKLFEFIFNLFYLNNGFLVFNSINTKLMNDDDDEKNNLKQFKQKKSILQINSKNIRVSRGHDEKKLDVFSF